MDFYVQHVALKSELLENQVELLLVEESAGNILSGTILIEESGGNIVISDIKVDPNKHKLRVLRGEETLGQLYTPNLTNCGHLVNSKCGLRKLFNKYM